MAIHSGEARRPDPLNASPPRRPGGRAGDNEETQLHQVRHRNLDSEVALPVLPSHVSEATGYYRWPTRRLLSLRPTVSVTLP